MAERIEIKSLSKNYKSHKVIENMNVTFPGGKIIGILGPNGSGKSTLIKMLAGVLQPNTGQILIDGEPVGVKSKAMVSYLPERTYLNPSKRCVISLHFSRISMLISHLNVQIPCLRNSELIHRQRSKTSQKVCVKKYRSCL